MNIRATVLGLALLSLAATASCGEDHIPISLPIDAATVMVDSPEGNTCQTQSAFLKDCMGTATCNLCECRTFGHYSYCTAMCTGPADCPAPSTGCFGGFCRR